MEKYYALFQNEEIDMSILRELDENKLRSVGLPLGTFLGYFWGNCKGSCMKIVKALHAHDYDHLMLKNVKKIRFIGSGNFGT